jgi:SPP1 gp7 family putative phage head morphogenesis protein
MLPEWKIHERKDYAWNRQKVENAITQGIIQGEGIEQITNRLTDALITTNENRMRTFARTSMTGAQNAGRQKQMEDAEDEGIILKKRWVATLDDRTRDTHAELDGQEVDVKEPFEVDGMEIMYPGDPDAEPELVYNCRCAMIEVYEGIDRKTVRRAYYDENDEEYEEGKRKSYEVEDMTYNEWKEWKEHGRGK